MMKKIAVSVALVLLGCIKQPVATARDNSVTASLSSKIEEEIIFIPSRDSAVRFETTIFSRGHYEDTKAPIVIINHGTNANGEQGRERVQNPSKFFVNMGYTVILSMRRGYSQSGGERARLYHCDLTRYGLENAADVEDVVIWLGKQDRFKRRKLIMIGQSTGGLTTIAYSSLVAHRVDAIINFHGGMRPSSPTDCKWQSRIDAFAHYAKTSSPRSLWFYTANDHSSNPEYISRLYKAFTEAGGTAKLVQLPAFEEDGHNLFGRATGGPIWQPIVLDYLKELNLLP